MLAHDLHGMRLAWIRDKRESHGLSVQVARLDINPVTVTTGGRVTRVEIPVFRPNAVEVFRILDRALEELLTSDDRQRMAMEHFLRCHSPAPSRTS